MTNNNILITLKSARVNNDLTQPEVVDILKRDYGIVLTRQKLASIENDSSELGVNQARAFSDLYRVPEDQIFFGPKSTLSYTSRKLQEV